MQCQVVTYFVVFVIAWAISSNITISFESEAWSMARRKSAYGTYNRQVYMAGGLAGDWTESNANTDIVRYNMATKTTTTLTTAPPYEFELRHPAEQCQIGDNLYYMPVSCRFNGCHFCDGDGGSGTACFVNTINLQNETITQLATSVPVHGRGALCGFIGSGEHRLFHVGGQPNDWEGLGTFDTYYTMQPRPIGCRWTTYSLQHQAQDALDIWEVVIQNLTLSTLRSNPLQTTRNRL
eukprot:952704_1